LRGGNQSALNTFRIFLGLPTAIICALVFQDDFVF